MTAAISRISDINLRLPRQHLKTPVFKCFLAMTGNSKIRGHPSALFIRASSTSSVYSSRVGMTLLKNTYLLHYNDVTKCTSFPRVFHPSGTGERESSIFRTRQITSQI